MLGRTHELAAITSVASIAILNPPEHITTETAIISIFAALIGGIAPDIDKPGSKIWDNIPAGGILSRIINPIFIGGHRHLTHSFLGLIIFGLLVRMLLTALPFGPNIDTTLVMWSFLIGFAAHLVTDSFTKEGVPLLFPLPFHVGIPPLESFRISTNGLVENVLVTPALIAIVVAVGYYNQQNTMRLLRAIGIDIGP